ncbi:MAG: hypothetical protein ACO3C1_00355 [Ilumatobacteraceae bacterium]
MLLRAGDLVDELAEIESAGRRPADLVDVVALGSATVVATVAIWSLVLAHLGVHSWWAAVVLTVVVLGPIVLSHRAALRAALRRRHRGWWLVLPVLAVATVLFFPGFRYATSDKDPGIYVYHGLEIAETGQLRFEATPLQRSGAITVTDVPHEQWRSFGSLDDGTLLPRFFHLWPALLATVFDVMGFGALAVITPMLGLVSVTTAFAVGRRLGGLLPGLAAASVLAVNMMNVWQARYPTAEMLGQVLFVAGLLAFVLAMQRDHRGAGVLAGVFVTAGFLNRGEVMAMVLLVAAGCAVAELLGHRRRIARAVALGMTLPLPLAMYQAYGPSVGYARGTGVPALGTMLGMLGVAAAGAIALPRVVPVVGRLVESGARRAARVVSRVAAVGIVLGFIAAAVRRFFGAVYISRNGELIRSFDEMSLWRLALFFGWLALVLAVVGAVWVVAVHPRSDRVLAVGIGLVFLALFLVKARNSPQMMWWGRRFVPVAVPCLALLIGLSFGAVRQRLRSARAAVLLFSVVMAASLGVQGLHSLSLVGHQERAGSYTIVERIAATAGDTHSLFLWERGPCCGAAAHLLGGALWAITDNDSALLPVEEKRAAYIETLHEAAGDMPILLVFEGADQPPVIDGVTYEVAGSVQGFIPSFEESETRRPSGRNSLPVDVTVYRAVFAD